MVSLCGGQRISVPAFPVDSAVCATDALGAALFSAVERNQGQSREQVAVELRSSSSEDAGTHLAWTAIHKNGAGAVISRQAHDLNKGYLP